VKDHDHISDLRWDRLLADELPAAERDATRAHADACVACGARLREIEAERGAFVLRPTTVVFQPAARRRTWWLGAPFAALAAALVLFVVLRPRDEDGGDRRKGKDAPSLLLTAGQPGQLVPLGAADTIHPGDYLQAGYTAKRDGFGAVLSVDGAGHAMAYVPANGDVLIALPAGTERSFPGSTVLDDALGTERIAIVWCDAPRPVAPLVEELRAIGAVADRDGCTIRIVVVTKAAPR
jgi:hypothetical protein